MRRARWIVPLVLVAVLAVDVPVSAWPGRARPDLALTTKAPYQPQGGPLYAPPPPGFTAVFTENVSRHGARDLSDPDEGNALIALWSAAKSQGGLTRLGQGLGPEVQRLLDANARIGYGLLTPSGARSLQQTAQRLERRLPQLFARAAANPSGTAITVESSSKTRTIQSAAAFVQGLDKADPKLTGTIAPDQVDDSLLYFHEAPINADYRNYVAHDPRLSAVETSVRDDPRTVRAARAMLLRSFTPTFVARIDAGAFADDFDGSVAAAQAIYDLWAVTADMPDEGPWHVDRYISTSEADWFGYLDDVTSFYENGPGFAGDDITYAMAGVLLDDMFAKLDAVRTGASHLVAALRFTHAEEVFPLAALLQLPESTTQQPVGTPFTYADNPFRGALVAPMGANIQWDLFRRGNTYLVRMLYNEQPTACKAACVPVSPGSTFYDLTSLERCYGRS